MIQAKENITAMIDALARDITARVELYEGSALLQIFNRRDNLKAVTVERTGIIQGKFFGFGVSHKLTANIIDKDRTINIEKGHRLELEFGTGSDYVYSYPVFVVAEVTRDENTNELTVTAYDFLQDATALTYADLELPEGYTLRGIAISCANGLGIPLHIEGVADDAFELLSPSGGNFEGTETLREVLDDIAEATQTIYYINSQWELTFKRLDKSGEAVLNIDKSKYFTLSTKSARYLETITITNELGDGVTASTGFNGAHQFIRDNAFYELRDDKGEQAEKALDAVGGLCITPYECEFRGNFLLEIGDKVTLTTKDNELVTSFILNDSLTYNGGMSQRISWSYEATNETASNPSTLGESLKQTFAKVDKANKKIELVASETSQNSGDIARLELETTSISATVKNDIEDLTKKVDATMSAEEVTLTIEEELSEGVDKVVTKVNKFTFDDEGLTIEKSDSDIRTNIDEDGLSVFKNDTEVLTADSKGVTAIDIKVKTYLIVGENSRFENYGADRTGCFWIGE